MKTAKSEDKLLAVVGSPRSGSTATFWALRKASKLFGIPEPDNSNMTQWQSEDVRNICEPLLQTNTQLGVYGLAEHLISCGVNLAKLMVGEDPQLCLKMSTLPLLVECGLTSGVVINYRENIFKQALSMGIAFETKWWHGDPEDFKNVEIGKLPTTQFERHLGLFKSYNDFVVSMSYYTSKKDKLFICKYEDFFEDQGNQEAMWKSLVQFLGYDYDSQILEQVNAKRYNGPHTYSRIENLSELEDIYEKFVRSDSERLSQLTSLPQLYGGKVG